MTSCPLCGCPGYAGLVTFECEGWGCENGPKDLEESALNAATARLKASVARQLQEGGSGHRFVVSSQLIPDQQAIWIRVSIIDRDNYSYVVERSVSMSDLLTNPFPPATRWIINEVEEHLRLGTEVTIE